MQDTIPGAERAFELTPDGASSIAALILASIPQGSQKAMIPTAGMAGIMRVRLISAGGLTVTDPITAGVATIPAGVAEFDLWGPEAADKVLTGAAITALVQFRYK